MSGWDPKSTMSAVVPGALRFVRTLDDDTRENPGLYLILGPAKDVRDGVTHWRVFVLSADPDVRRELDGQLTEHSDDWLVEWTEPMP